MEVPKYIKELLSKASYNYEAKLRGYSVGYTIDIPKLTWRTLISTHEKEVNRLLNWVKREYYRTYKADDWDSIAYFNYIPSKTRYANQYITVTILDPMMKKIEGFIPSPKHKKERFL